jgi:hypothetical protein
VTYLFVDLGRVEKGAQVEFQLSGNAANVRLMDPSNYWRYQRGETFEFYGGLTRQSIQRLAVPAAGQWYAVVDLKGLAGTTRAKIKRIPASTGDRREKSRVSRGGGLRVSLEVAAAYRVFGLEPGAEGRAVTAAYRELAKHCHPDRAHDDPQRRALGEREMLRLNAARERIQGFERNQSATPGTPGNSGRGTCAGLVDTRGSL